MVKWLIARKFTCNRYICDFKLRPKSAFQVNFDFWSYARFINFNISSLEVKGNMHGTSTLERSPRCSQKCAKLANPYLTNPSHLKETHAQLWDMTSR